MPAVTVLASASGEPMASTGSPTATASESPNCDRRRGAGRRRPAAPPCRTRGRGRPASAGGVVPSWKVTMAGRLPPDHVVVGDHVAVVGDHEPGAEGCRPHRGPDGHHARQHPVHHAARLSGGRSRHRGRGAAGVGAEHAWPAGRTRRRVAERAAERTRHQPDQQRGHQQPSGTTPDGRSTPGGAGRRPAPAAGSAPPPDRAVPRSRWVCSGRATGRSAVRPPTGSTRCPDGLAYPLPSAPRDRPDATAAPAPPPPAVSPRVRGRSRIQHDT